MNLLHAHYNLRNLQAFQRALTSEVNDRSQSTTGGLSSSGGKSWNRSSSLNMAMSTSSSSSSSCDVNARDWLGRSVLHLACASAEPAALEYVKLLLSHPAINVNLCDLESHWTALHRALYNGNLSAALLLLQRSDLDRDIKDVEGYTAFDLYNSTVQGTKPGSGDDMIAELFTWGTNRNAALGVGDGDDRVFPDQVIIREKESSSESEHRTLEARFSPIGVRQVQMSKLHTAVVTSESRGNLRVCGFGSGGRLGPGQHTQYSLKPLHQFSHTIDSVALGQDHTLALTKSGEVLSWGLNRFSQLGYVVEMAAVGPGRLEEPIQATARKVQGPLKKEVVLGVAACKSASACWTGTEVYTWGTNNGQLGYDKAAQPVQILPRKVTKVTQPVLAVSITDSAMACLLDTKDVMCIWNDRYFKINFPTQAFPSEIQPYRPPQAIKDADIAKITSCDDTFAALSSNGELFTFTVPNPSEAERASGKDRSGIKPQRVWALRKQFSAVRDVALGSDGSIAICTESGHVFARSRNAKGGTGKAFKFKRIPYIQRVIRVCANATGAFGAIRVDSKMQPIVISGNGLAQDLTTVQPYLLLPDAESEVVGLSSSAAVKQLLSVTKPEQDEDGDDVGIQRDLEGVHALFNFLQGDKKSRSGPDHHGLFDNLRPHGADLNVQVQSLTFPVHSVLLSARTSILGDILSGSNSIQDSISGISIRFVPASSKMTSRLAFTGCHGITILILIYYLYSDELIAIWDRRVATVLERELKQFKINTAQVKTELQTLARILVLPLLTPALGSPAKRAPEASMVHDISELFHRAQAHKTSPLSFPRAPDVVLQLSDKEVFSHSVVLRARSVFFASFFDQEEWTVKRWDASGMITVNMKHLEWRVMEYVLRFLCCGEDERMFDVLPFVTSVDDLLEFMFEVMAAANELLLDRLVLICSSVILKLSNVNNVCYVLTDATHYHAQQLIESLQGYIAANLEMMLESQMLDCMTPALISQLGDFIRRKQKIKSPVSRSNLLVDHAMRHHSDWLALQDIPQQIVPTHRPPRKELTRVVKRVASKPFIRNSPSSLTKHVPLPGDDGVFLMDDSDAPPPLSSEQPAGTSPWKAPSIAPRTNMKTIIAEAEAAMPGPSSSRTPPRKTDFPDAERPPSMSRPSGSPWKSVRISAPIATPGFPSPAGTPVNTPPRTKEIGMAGPSTATPRSTSLPPSPPQAKPKPRDTVPGLGPVFIPLRQPLSKPGLSIPPASRRTLSGSNGAKAWTLPPVQPVVVQSPSSPGLPVGMSFVAIQQLQIDQDAYVPGKDKRSLREIQEEERSRQEEADFLKWWAAEEERVKLEAEALSQPKGRSRPSPGKPPRKNKGGKAKAVGIDTTTSGTSPRGGQPRRHVGKNKAIPAL